MPCRITIEDGLLRIELSGVLSRRDLDRMVEHVSSVERVDGRVLDRIADLGGITDAEVAFPDFHDLVERRLATDLPNPIKTALVAPQPVQLGYARMFQTLNTHPRVEVRIFDEVEGAMAWLRPSG